MKIINIQPLAKLLAILITDRSPKQTKQNMASKEANNSSGKAILTKQTEKPDQPAQKSLPEQQADKYYNAQNYAVIPAPVKTTLFEKAQFLYRESNQSKAAANDKTGTLLIKLETLNLGRLWITVTSGNDTLGVKFFGKQKTTIELIKEHLPVLKEELVNSNFKHLSFKCQVCDEVWLHNNILKDFEQDNISFINFKV